MPFPERERLVTPRQILATRTFGTKFLDERSHGCHLAKAVRWRWRGGLVAGFSLRLPQYTQGVVVPQEAHPVPMNYVRLTQPLVRDSKGAELRPASWDEALTRVVEGFHAAKAQHGPTTFGVFSCSKATNEVNFAAQKFSRAVLGSNNIDSCNRT